MQKVQANFIDVKSLQPVVLTLGHLLSMHLVKRYIILRCHLVSERLDHRGLSRLLIQHRLRAIWCNSFVLRDRDNFLWFPGDGRIFSIEWCFIRQTAKHLKAFPLLISNRISRGQSHRRFARHFCELPTKLLENLASLVNILTSQWIDKVLWYSQTQGPVQVLYLAKVTSHLSYEHCRRVPSSRHQAVSFPI